MTNQEAAVILLEGEKAFGLIHTLHTVFGKGIKVKVPFTKAACNTDIEDLLFSVRSHNALKRSGLFTVGQVIDALNDESLLKIRNLGVKSAMEIQTKILQHGYDQLTDSEKKTFFIDIINKNGYAEKIQNLKY